MDSTACTVSSLNRTPSSPVLQAPTQPPQLPALPVSTLAGARSVLLAATALVAQAVPQLVLLVTFALQEPNLLRSSPVLWPL